MICPIPRRSLHQTLKNPGKNRNGKEYVQYFLFLRNFLLSNKITLKTTAFKPNHIKKEKKTKNKQMH